MPTVPRPALYAAAADAATPHSKVRGLLSVTNVKLVATLLGTCSSCSPDPKIIGSFEKIRIDQQSVVIIYLFIYFVFVCIFIYLID